MKGSLFARQTEAWNEKNRTSNRMQILFTLTSFGLLGQLETEAVGFNERPTPKAFSLFDSVVINSSPYLSLHWELITLNTWRQKAVSMLLPAMQCRLISARLTNGDTIKLLCIKGPRYQSYSHGQCSGVECSDERNAPEEDALKSIDVVFRFVCLFSPSPLSSPFCLTSHKECLNSVGVLNCSSSSLLSCLFKQLIFPEGGWGGPLMAGLTRWGTADW